MLKGATHGPAAMAGPAIAETAGRASAGTGRTPQLAAPPLADEKDLLHTLIADELREDQLIPRLIPAFDEWDEARQLVP